MEINICIKVFSLTIYLLRVLANDSAANLPFSYKVTVFSLLELLVHMGYQIVGMSVNWKSSFKMQRRVNSKHLQRANMWLQPRTFFRETSILLNFVGFKKPEIRPTDKTVLAYNKFAPARKEGGTGSCRTPPENYQVQVKEHLPLTTLAVSNRI